MFCKKSTSINAFLLRKPISQKNWSGYWQALICSILSIDLQTLRLRAAHALLSASPKHTTWR